jgi:hypothetical protein
MGKLVFKRGRVCVRENVGPRGWKKEGVPLGRDEVSSSGQFKVIVTKGDGSLVCVWQQQRDTLIQLYV